MVTSAAYVGVLWDNPVGYDHGNEASGHEPRGAVRFRRGGMWGAWLPLTELDGSRLGVDTDVGDGWAITWDSTAAADGPHTLAAVGTDTVGQTGTATISVTVDNGDGGGGSTAMHVGDLDGSAKGTKNEWSATVTVTVVDDAGHPVADAKVDGTWTTLASAGTCTIDATGACAVTSQRVRKSIESLTYQVDAVTHATLSYAPAANSDPEGDSTGTTIAVSKPA